MEERERWKWLEQYSSQPVGCNAFTGVSEKTFMLWFITRVTKYQSYSYEGATEVIYGWGPHNIEGGSIRKVVLGRSRTTGLETGTVTVTAKSPTTWWHRANVPGYTVESRKCPGSPGRPKPQAWVTMETWEMESQTWEAGQLEA